MREYSKKPATRDEVLIILGKIIKDRENYVYVNPNTWTSCVYIVNNQPSCIIGHVCRVVGISKEILQLWNNETIPQLPKEILRYFTPAAIRLMNYVQMAQDGRVVEVHNKMSWGDAVAYGIESTKRK